jgi:hypothetical protein
MNVSSSASFQVLDETWARRRGDKRDESREKSAGRKKGAMELLGLPGSLDQPDAWISEGPPMSAMCTDYIRAVQGETFHQYFGACVKHWVTPPSAYARAA